MPYRRITEPMEGTSRTTGELSHTEDAAEVNLDDTVFSDRGRRYFQDVGFPATRDDIYASAVAHGAPQRMLDAIRDLPAHEVFHEPDDLPDLYERAGMHASDDAS